MFLRNKCVAVNFLHAEFFDTFSHVVVRLQVFFLEFFVIFTCYDASIIGYAHPTVEKK